MQGSSIDQDKGLYMSGIYILIFSQICKYQYWLIIVLIIYTHDSYQILIVHMMGKEYLK